MKQHEIKKLVSHMTLEEKAGCATASGFDRDLVRKLGETLGVECQAENVSIILGPALNIKRSPLCGRNFEYYSEDPYLSSEIASAMVEGVQSKNVGTGGAVIRREQ